MPECMYFADEETGEGGLLVQAENLIPFMGKIELSPLYIPLVGGPLTHYGFLEAIFNANLGRYRSHKVSSL